MKNLFLKQVSLIVMGAALVIGGAGGVKAANDESIVMSKVKSYADPRDKKGQEWIDILESPWSTFDGFSYSKHESAYNKITSKINGLKGKKMGDFKSSFSKDWNDLQDDMKEGAEGMADTFSTEAWSDALKAAREDSTSLISRKEASIGREAAEELINRASSETRVRDDGIPTLDVGNIVVGMYNVDAVIGTFHYNEDIRDHDTRACAEMGVSGLSGGNVSTGEFCCLLWEESGDSTGFGALKGALAGGLGGGTGGAAAGAIGGAIGAWDGNRLAEKRGQAGYDYCCRLSDDPNEDEEYVLCQAKSAEKAECLNGKLSGGSSAEEAWKACDIECGDKDYGSLSYDDDGQYDAKAVGKLMKECYEEENKWSPSTTVPTSSELAPVIPDVVRNGVTGKKGGNNDDE